MSLADNVKFLRECANLTQAELGEKLGKGQTTIQKIETGQTLRPRFLPELAGILGVTAYELEYTDMAGAKENLDAQEEREPLISRGKFPAACGVNYRDERIYPQKPQC